MVASHTLEVMIDDCDQCFMSLVPLILLGLSYTTYAVVLWGSLPYMVEARTLGTAFGICTSFQNFGTVIAPPIIGYINTATADINQGYTFVSIFFIIMSILAFVFNFGVYAWDLKKRNNLLQSVMPMEDFEKYI